MCQKTKTFRMPLVAYLIRKMSRPKVMVFDLDDTMMPWPTRKRLPNGKKLNFHTYMANIFAKVVMEDLNSVLPKEEQLDFDDASGLCEDGYRNYGSSMIGLMNWYPQLSDKQLEDIFLRVHHHAATHPVKGVNAWAKPNLKLNYLLKQLTTKPYVFTHGSTEYAKVALKAMGLLNTVIPEENVFGLEMYGYHNTKNKPSAYVWLQAKTGLPYNRMIMSEDSHKNLKYAKKLGMKTVLLQRPDDYGEPFPDFPYVDHTHQTLEDYIQMFLDKGINYTENKQVRSVNEQLWEFQPHGRATIYMQAVMQTS